MKFDETNRTVSNMRGNSSLGCTIVLAALVFAAPPASSCITAGPVPLKTLARRADVVIKATVIANHPINDPSFEKSPGLEVSETEMRVVSIIKGTASKIIEFRHYAPISRPISGMLLAPMMCPPPSYRLVIGRTYIVLATRVARDKYDQLSKSFTGWDGSVLPAADAKPLQAGTTVTQAVWGALVAQLKSSNSAVTLKAIGLLDEMSGDGRFRAKDFDRSQVLAAIQPLIAAKDVAVSTAVINEFAMDSRYTDDWSTVQWLAGIGKGTFPGVAPRKAHTGPLAHHAARLLLRVAKSDASPKVRALAITALARSHAISGATIAEWFRDPSIAVRKAAVLASAAILDRTIIQAALSNGSPEIRRAAALAIGFTQDTRLLPLLGTLLKDPAPAVRAAAAMSLISFGPAQAAPVMRANLVSQFGPLFVNALARRNPRPYLPLLAKIIQEQPQPADWWGGALPADDSWKLLFDYIKSCPTDEFTSGELNRWLDALEMSHWFGSFEPQELYALYLQRGLVSRARRFRDMIRKSPIYINSMFNRVERDPAAYLQ